VAGTVDGRGNDGAGRTGGDGGLAWPADSAGPSGSAEPSDIGHAAESGGAPATAAPAPAAAKAAGSGTPGAGTKAPAFSLMDQHGQTIDLAAHAGTRAVLLVFYPYAFSRVCGSELHAISADLEAFQNDDVQILAVSCDPLYALRAYADAEGFEFPLLADHWPHGAAARAYGVFDEDRGCAVRGTFLIDRTGTVRWSVVNGLAEARDLADYRAAISALGAGQA
jgi:mycoredoxin-dependent peroxiredoxin